MCVLFPDMPHGWMTRGPFEEENIRRDYRLGLKLLLSFAEERMASPTS